VTPTTVASAGRTGRCGCPCRRGRRPAGVVVFVRAPPRAAGEDAALLRVPLADPSFAALAAAAADRLAAAAAAAGAPGGGGRQRKAPTAFRVVGPGVAAAGAKPPPAGTPTTGWLVVNDDDVAALAEGAVLEPVVAKDD
jgi:hypothetical protein